MKITIRKALPEDAHAYALCHISCFQTAYRGIVPDDYLDNMDNEKDQRAERYRNAFTDPGDCVYYCAMYGERMIGFLVINANGDDQKSGVGAIWAVYLMEEFRGKGYGKQMLHYAVSQLKRAGCDEINLWVFEQNHRARRFYERNHFSFDGVKREHTYGKPLVQLRYALNAHDESISRSS